jgi:NADH:ubiquinone oxidoreductase subunit 5 (subunit L)/multisubunit Na+/H+ antiporter MnhA subunit
LFTTVLVLGVGALLWITSRGGSRDPVVLLGHRRSLVRSGFGIDGFYDRVVVRPVALVAATAGRADVEGVDRAVEGSARLVLRGSTALRVVGAGRVRTYLAALLAGVLVLVISVAVSV